MSIEPERFDPEDLENIKLKLKDAHPNIPCNIYGYIKELESRLQQLEARIKELEK